MKRGLIITYKVIGFIINPLIILAMLFWLLVILFDTTETFSLIDYIVGLMLSWSSISWIYYIQKTRKMKHLINNSNDQELVNNNSKRFKLDKLISVSNIILGLVLIVYSIFILITDPIQDLKGDEPFRAITILIALIYSVLQIQYAVMILKLIDKQKISE